MVLTNSHNYKLTVEGSGCELKGALKLDDIHTSPGKQAVLEEFTRSAALCNDGVLHKHKEVGW